MLLLMEKGGLGASSHIVELDLLEDCKAFDDLVTVWVHPTSDLRNLVTRMEQVNVEIPALRGREELEVYRVTRRTRRKGNQATTHTP